MTYKDKHKRDQHYNMLLQSQVMNILNSLKLMTEYAYDNHMLSLSEFTIFRPSATPSFRDMKNMEFNEDCFVQSLIDFFDTLKKSDNLNKYEIKFSIKPKQQQNKISKEKMLKK
jgi:hypothetical protein